MTSASWIHWKLWSFYLLFLNQINTSSLPFLFHTGQTFNSIDHVSIWDFHPDWISVILVGGCGLLNHIFNVHSDVLCEHILHLLSSHISFAKMDLITLSLSLVRFQTCTCVHHFVFLPGCLCGLYTWIDSNLLLLSSESTQGSFFPCQPSVNATKTPLYLSLCFKTISSYDA